LYSEATSDSNPLNTERTTIRAMVPTMIPIAEIPEITLIMLCDFLEIRYRRAM
jgi:hypothetical protein